MYKHILLPTDGSTGAEKALEHVIDIGTTYDATVHVLYVVDSENELSHLVAQDEEGTGHSGMVKHAEVERESGLVHESNEDLERLEEIGTELVTATADRLSDAGVEVRTEVRHGTPHRAITTYAVDNDIDLIVMPTHGRRGFDRYLLGSVTEKVVRTADVPVLTVRTGAQSDTEATD